MRMRVSLLWHDGVWVDVPSEGFTGSMIVRQAWYSRGYRGYIKHRLS